MNFPPRLAVLLASSLLVHSTLGVSFSDWLWLSASHHSLQRKLCYCFLGVLGDDGGLMQKHKQNQLHLHKYPLNKCGNYAVKQLVLLVDIVQLEKWGGW